MNSAETYLTLILAWTLWCSLHSLLISRRVMRLFDGPWKKIKKYHRIGFNLFAIITFLAVGKYEASLPKSLLFQFDGFLNILRIALTSIGVLLFLGGAASYSLTQFLGLRQLFSSASHQVLTASGQFSATGLHSVTRHPWYSAAFLLIWFYSPHYHDTDLVTNLVFTLYLVIGTRLEERKLVVQFGEAYRQYQKEVSMFFPFKWFGGKLGNLLQTANDAPRRKRRDTNPKLRN